MMTSQRVNQVTVSGQGGPIDRPMGSGVGTMGSGFSFENHVALGGSLPFCR